MAWNSALCALLKSFIIHAIKVVEVAFVSLVFVRERHISWSLNKLLTSTNRCEVQIEGSYRGSVEGQILQPSCIWLVVSCRLYLWGTKVWYCKSAEDAWECGESIHSQVDSSSYSARTHCGGWSERPYQIMGDGVMYGAFLCNCREGDFFTYGLSRELVWNAPVAKQILLIWTL